MRGGSVFPYTTFSSLLVYTRYCLCLYTPDITIPKQVSKKLTTEI